MGLDFIRKTGPSFHKGLDQKRIDLATPTLFTQHPAAAPRSYAAHIRRGRHVTAGEKLGVRLDGDCVVALRGLDPIAIIDSPPAELVEALSASHGEACGIVQDVHDIADVAEITVC